MWFLVIFLASCSIILGLVLGYNNAQQADVVEPPSANSEQPVKPNPTKPLQAPKPAAVIAKKTVENNDNKEEDEDVSRPEYEYELDQYAIESMAEARLNGDDRAPPIGKSAETEAPTAEELESPELYLEYESRQEQKIFKAYVEAADIKIDMLEEQIAKAKAQGLPEEELAVGIEKVRRIKEMKAQLLSENPGLQ